MASNYPILLGWQTGFPRYQLGASAFVPLANASRLEVREASQWWLDEDMIKMSMMEAPNSPALGDELRRELLASDRCDSCGARAWVRVLIDSTELLFCAHHGSIHMEALSKTADFVQDDRDQLLDEA